MNAFTQRHLVGAALGLLLVGTISACSSGSTVDGTTDASKLDDDMEKQALAIEQRADAAAEAVEAEASAELERIQAEARDAETAVSSEDESQ